MGGNMDDLQECAIAYSRLLDFGYRIIIGRKRNQKEITLRFDSSEFHHLMGLHYLEDLDYFMKTSKTKIFSDIVEGKKCLLDVQKSYHYKRIEDRIKEFSKIVPTIFDVNKIVFRFINPTYFGSSIKAEYLIKYTSHTGVKSFLFLDKDTENSQFHFFKSFFVFDFRDYSENQSSYIVVYIEKINLKTQETEIILNKIR